MSFNLEQLADPEFVSEHRMAAHSDHRWYRDAQEAATGTSSFEQCLNGLWKFHYAKNPAQLVDGFESPDLDCSDWDDIPVPAHIQLQGYDRPQYTNVQYPWDGLEAISPGQIPSHHNPVASYVTSFTLDRPLAPGERLSVMFHGAESAIALWLNGQYIGYATDSSTPSEFDLTDALAAGSNKLAARVFRFSSGSWLEDQDFFRFSGLFRDVVLLRRPVVHVENLRVTTDLSPDLSEARVTLRAAHEGGTVRARLAGVGDLSDDGAGALTIPVARPRLWSSEDPYLYDLEISVFDDSGQLTEYIPQQVGIRRFGIEDGVLRINGKRLVFNGVNRHEFGLRGRVMTRAETEVDLKLLKANGVNAIRTSHYPNNSFFYELCDSYGFYVIDEMNLETHGSWDAHRTWGAPPEQVIPGDWPEWRAALADRAASVFERDKNHASVVMWSLGNESFGGSNLLEVADWFRSVDSRPVHYEGVTWDPRYPDTTDVASQMYTSAEDLEAWLATNRDKPFILCEYAHAMGNSFGAVDKYISLAYREPLFQGGFIWDFADQVLPTRDHGGREYLGYGGDFGDAPHDAEFSANGIVFVDRSPTPKLVEAKYLYRPLVAAISREAVSVTNRMLFTNSSVYECVVTLRREGQVLAEAWVQTNVAPGEVDSYPLPLAVPEGPGEYTVDVSFREREQTRWAAAGHEVAWEQAVFRNAPESVAPAAAGGSLSAGGGSLSAAGLEVIEGIHNVGVRGRNFTALFSRGLGGLTSYRYGPGANGGREMLRAMPKPNFWHAPTSNEKGWGMGFEDGQWLLASRYAKPVEGAMTVEVTDASARIGYSYVLPTAPESQCDVTYEVSGDGRIEVVITVRPGEGLSDMPEFGMMLTTDADLHNLTWYGDGPDECYVDRCQGVRLDVHHADVHTQLTPYVRPQEAGSHTGVRWATVTDAHGTGLRFFAAEPMEFSALPWTPFEVENAAHPNELPPIEYTILRPALMRRGVGGDDSWGARTHPEYLLPSDSVLVFRFGFQGIG